MSGQKKLAIDCEMVGDQYGRNVLARVSIVNENLSIIYDKYSKPECVVGDYRTQFSGILPRHLTNADPFQSVREEVGNLIRGAILVGHSLHHDLDVLKLDHPMSARVDVKDFPQFRRDSGGRTPGLRLLASRYLYESIQNGSHDSIEDARTAMKLYNRFIKK